MIVGVALGIALVLALILIGEVNRGVRALERMDQRQADRELALDEELAKIAAGDRGARG